MLVQHAVYPNHTVHPSLLLFFVSQFNPGPVARVIFELTHDARRVRKIRAGSDLRHNIRLYIKYHNAIYGNPKKSPKISKRLTYKLL